MIEKRPCVYILASQRNGTLYGGATSNLARRVFEHKEGAIKASRRSVAFTILSSMSSMRP
ncbi:MAG TPA: GIY-YIG nuclease family protein [Stellaceae bacterium]|nr:GIY-YIG nuclease family protein [Stellaceae bacterium]